MIVYRFVGMSVHGQWLPTKATNIWPPTNNVDSTVDNVRRVKNIIEMAKHFRLFCYCNQHFVKTKKMCTQILYSYHIYIYMCIHSYANLLISQGFTQNVTAICYSCIIKLVNCFIKDKNFRRDIFIIYYKIIG